MTDSGQRRFLDQVANHRILTRSEEHELFRQLRAGDDTAREKLILANMKLVISVMRAFRGRSLSDAELIQEGVIGLNRAIERFDHSRGIKLSTYATWWIKQACQRAVTSYGETIHVPAQVNIHRARAYKILNQRPDATNEDIAEELGVEPHHVERALAAATVVSSIDTPTTIGGDEAQALSQLLPDLNAEDPADVVTRRDTGGPVRAALSRLQDDERVIVELRFGFNGAHPHSFAEIAKATKIPQHRAQAMHKTALRKLASYMRDDTITTDVTERGRRAATERAASSSHLACRRATPPAPLIEEQVLGRCHGKCGRSEDLFFEEDTIDEGLSCSSSSKESTEPGSLLSQSELRRRFARLGSFTPISLPVILLKSTNRVSQPTCPAAASIS